MLRIAFRRMCTVSQFGDTCFNDQLAVRVFGSWHGSKTDSACLDLGGLPWTPTMEAVSRQGPPAHAARGGGRAHCGGRQLRLAAGPASPACTFSSKAMPCHFKDNICGKLVPQFVLSWPLPSSALLQLAQRALDPAGAKRSPAQ